MNTRLSLRRGIAVLTFAVLLAATATTAAGAKPRPAFAPQTGTYTGTSVSKGDHHVQGAKVAKKGSRYSVEMAIQVPAECEDAALGVALPEALIYKVTVPVKGKTLSFKGDAPEMSVLQGQDVAVDLSGHFTGGSAFTATVKSSVSAEPGNPESTSCTVDTATLKLKHS